MYRDQPDLSHLNLVQLKINKGIYEIGTSLHKNQPNQNQRECILRWFTLPYFYSSLFFLLHTFIFCAPLLRILDPVNFRAGQVTEIEGAKQLVGMR